MQIVHFKTHHFPYIYMCHTEIYVKSGLKFESPYDGFCTTISHDNCIFSCKTVGNIYTFRLMQKQISLNFHTINVPIFQFASFSRYFYRQNTVKAPASTDCMVLLNKMKHISTRLYMFVSFRENWPFHSNVSPTENTKTRTHLCFYLGLYVVFLS